MEWSRFKAEPEKIVLYSYWRSSASWRVRWALNLKKIHFEIKAINLLKGENKSIEHLKRNAMGAIPVLELHYTKATAPFYLSQSSSILDWIEEVYALKGPALFPGLPLERAYIKSLCQFINADTTPLQTPRVQKRHSADAVEQKKWAQDFIREGLTVYLKMSEVVRGLYSFQDEISAADMFLIPQIYNAIRYEVDVRSEFKALGEIYDRCLKTDACIDAAPEQQADCPNI